MSEDEFNPKEGYSKLYEEFKLPEFEELDNEFEISFIDKEPFFIRSIRRKMNEKVIFFCRIIEGVIFPQAASYINSVENKEFSDEEKKKVLIAYRKLMTYERRSLRIDTDPSDELDAKYVKDLNKDWNGFKKILEKFVKNMENAWKKEEEASTEGFFG